MLGAENVILEIAKNSHKFGFNSIIGIIKEFSDPNPQFLDHARANDLQYAVFESNKAFPLNCASEINKFVHKNSVDVLHCHGYKEDFYGIASLTGLPKISTNHLWKKSTCRLKIYRLMDIMFLYFFDMVVGVSRELVQEMHKFGLNNTAEVSNGIDISRFYKRSKNLDLLKKFGISESEIVLGMISSLTPEKNHKIVIECLSKKNLPNIRLLIVGDGPFERYLKVEVKNKNLENIIIFAGRQENISQILSVIDIFLIPSLAEGLPMAMLEAMACEKAVIAAKVGEIVNVIGHGINGLSIAPNNVLELGSCIETLVYDQSLITRYGKEARKTIKERFSSMQMTEKYCEIYKSVLGNL